MEKADQLANRACPSATLILEMHANRAEATAEALVKSTADAGLDFCSVSQLCTGSEMLPLEMPTHHMCWDIFPFCKNKYLLKPYDSIPFHVRS